MLGLEETGRLLDELPPGPRLDRIREFVDTAQLALDQTGSALRATANPIELVQASERGRSWVLSAQVQAYALALVTTLLALLLAAGSLAAERDENVAGRLARGLATLGQLVAAKAALAAVVTLLLGTAIALTFGLAVELGNVEGGEPWERVPLLAAGIAVTGASVGALGALVGALAREARSASLVAVLVVLPILFIGLVPREVAPVAGWISDALPFAHAVRLFASALYDVDPWRTVLVEAAWLVALGLVFLTGARVAARRLVDVSSFPVTRLRRMRRSAALRSLVRETRLDLDAFVMPLFVGPDTKPNPELPPLGRFSVEELVGEVEGLVRLGVPAVILFGIPEEKDDEGSGAWDDDGIVQRALRALRPRFPELLLLTDVCLCEYTAHGHCGVLRDGEVANDESLELLARTAVSHVAAGADAVAPSDMMDGRVGAIRAALDDAGHDATPIVSYAAKYASAFYGPFREAAESTPSFGDRRGYQMDPRTCARRCASASSTSTRARTC